MGLLPSPGAAARLLLGALSLYKRLISPLFAGSCRFLPSCADYAREAVVRHGAVQGSWLALTRLGRCHPLCAAGYDPVPQDSGWRVFTREPRTTDASEPAARGWR